jgi:hypothetical protein
VVGRVGWISFFDPIFPLGAGFVFLGMRGMEMMENARSPAGVNGRRLTAKVGKDREGDLERNGTAEQGTDGFWEPRGAFLDFVCSHVYMARRSFFSLWGSQNPV